ncbi:MAG: sulfurtransferase [candidate division NC10 bacterium]|nr:sulfurtransferase [candidate division NC10 bacterium]
MRRMVMAGVATVTLLAAIGGTALAAGYANPQFLVETDWLIRHLNDRDLRIIDMRDRLEEYAAGHIPGAVYLAVNQIRRALKEPGFVIPPDYELEEILGQLGITGETMVVAYDDQGGLNASRLFYTLGYAGHGKMALLNGGLTKWVAEGRSLAIEVSRVAKTVYRVHPDTGRVASGRWIAANLGKPNLALVDARSPKEFRGEDVRAKRGGHIPGAANIEWTQNLTADKTFKSADELLNLYEKAGVTKDKTTVTYCQTMHRASLSYFALRLLGYPDVRGYDRSWSEWGNDPALLVER